MWVATGATWGPTTGVPSPKSHVYVAMESPASGSDDPDPSTVIDRGSIESGVIVKEATGTRFPVRTTVSVMDEATMSVAVIWTAPGWETLTPVNR